MTMETARERRARAAGSFRQSAREAVVLACALLVPADAVRPADEDAEDEVWPGATWERSTPRAAGLDPEPLEELADFAGGQGCVVRGGRLVFTWGDVAKRQDVASAAKPIYSHFLFVALEEGKIPGIDERVVKHEPRLGELNPGLDHPDREISWRHLATQTSCYGLRERPGEAFAYNDWQMALFFDLLFLEVWGAEEHERVDEEVLRPHLTGPLQCQDRPTLLAFGPDDRAGRLRISVRDFARFGLLYLRGGRWLDRRLLPELRVETATTSPLPNSIPRAGREAADMLPGQRSIGSRRIPDNQTDHMGSYSYLWWTNGVDREGRRHWPDAPHDAYGAFGHGGPRAMVVIPSLDTVVSWNDTGIRGREKENRALALVAEAARAGGDEETSDGDGWRSRPFAGGGTSRSWSLHPAHASTAVRGAGTTPGCDASSRALSDAVHGIGSGFGFGSGSEGGSSSCSTALR